MIVKDNFNQNVAQIYKISWSQNAAKYSFFKKSTDPKISNTFFIVLVEDGYFITYPLWGHWCCEIVGPANSDLADNRIMSFPLCNLNIVAVMVKILLNMKKFSQKKRHFSGAKRGWESMSQFCTNSLHSQEKWTVALVEEHYSLCNYNLCSGR